MHRPIDMWPRRRIQDLFAVKHPIVQAPMAGSSGVDLAVAVAEAGGLGSLPFADVAPAEMRLQVDAFRARTKAPLNVNFFCHEPPPDEPERSRAWEALLAPYRDELGLQPSLGPMPKGPFDDGMCAVVEATRPEIVSFHFGLPEPGLVARVKAAGAKVVSTATTVAEARWLEARGCDAIIAQGAEAGGHRGMFLSKDVAQQPGTFALVPQVVDAVEIPVIAAGGVADARGIVAAFALGASAVQIGTAYLKCVESTMSELGRKALDGADDASTFLTNVYTGRPARGLALRFARELGPLADDAPTFPMARRHVVPLRTRAEAAGSTDFSGVWAGQSVALARAGRKAGDLTRELAAEALRLF